MNRGSPASADRPAAGAASQRGSVDAAMLERIVSRLAEICGDPLVLTGSDKRLEYVPAPADAGEST